MSYEVNFEGESSYDQLWCNFDVAGQGDSISKATLKHPHSQLDKIIKTVSELIIEKNNKELEHFLQTNLKTLTDCHKNIVDCQEQISRFDAEKYFNSLEFLKKEAEYDLKAIEYLNIVQVNLQIRKAEKISNSIARKIKKIFS